MKKSLLSLVLALVMVVSLCSTAFAYENISIDSSISPDGKATLKYPEIYYKVANRIYNDYMAGKTTTEIWLKGVEFKAIQSNGDDYVNTILSRLDGTVADLTVTKDGNITKIKAVTRTMKDYINSDKLNEALDKLIAETDKFSNIKDKLGYINDKIAKECAYDKSVLGQTAEDVLINKAAVCGGFTNFVHEVCKRLGVKESPVMTKDGYHIFNIVHVDGKWQVWDLAYNAMQKASHGKQVLYHAEPRADGEWDMVKGPGERQYFLMEIGTPRYAKYIKDIGTTEYDFGLSEALKSIKYPEEGKLDLSLTGLEVPVTSSGETPKPTEQPKPTPTPTPDNSGVKYIVVDENGNLVIVDPNKPKETPKQTPPANVKAKPTKSSVVIDGKKVAFEAYNINGNNYFKLRDIAAALNGTKKNFEVQWDGANNAIQITKNKKYTVTGGELAVAQNPTEKDAKLTTSKIYVNGKLVNFTAYNINGNNYFKLRDVAAEINFGVLWDGAANTIRVDTKVDYTE